MMAHFNLGRSDRFIQNIFLKKPLARSIVSMADVARLAGVACSTVSRALRDDPAIPTARCTEIKKLAAQVGYRPNPLVSTLMAHLHHRRRRTDPDYIAWIDLWPTDVRPPAVSMLKPLYVGAQMRAQQLGYKLEVHRAGGTALRAERLRQILLARSQWGFIVPPVPDSEQLFKFDMHGLAGVAIGTSWREPRIHRVTTNHFHSAEIAFRGMQAQGFRRIALALSRSMNERVHGLWLGGFVASQIQEAIDPVIPPLLAEESERKIFESWVKKYRPDAILSAEPFIANWLDSAKSRKKPALAWLASEPSFRIEWGLDYRAETIGAAAVEMVVAQLHRNERGAPATTQTLLIESVWNNP